MTIDEMIAKKLENNPELKAVLENDSKKMEAYKKKVADSLEQRTGYTEQEANNRCKFCKSCIFSHGKPPFADLPEKAYCVIYPKENGRAKPPDVYYNGAECEYYEQEKRKR